ncbi:MAG: zf-HC2 domain-containing protein [Planctomycetes bacterium]|nr:zf-HC2 domain-containing protein [Planctomycetota bacterium]
MNCSECQKYLVAYLEDLLRPETKQDVTDHIDECRRCREEVSQLMHLRNRLIADGKTYQKNNMEDAVLSRIIPAQAGAVDIHEEPNPFPENFFEEVASSDDQVTQKCVKTESLPKQKKSNTQSSFRRLIMNSTFTRIAAAAIIIIGIGLGIHIFTQDTAITWAEVFAQVEKVEGVMYRMKTVMTGIPQIPGGVLEQENHIKISNPFGLQVDTYMEGKLAARTFALLPEESIVSVLPEQHRYITIKFTPEIFEKMREENGDPSVMIDGFKEYEYVELGRKTIDGVEVEGIESTDPRFAEGILGNVTAQLWVDVETGWPFKMILEVLGDDGSVQLSLVSDNFQWGVEFGAVEFAADIPADYIEMGNIDLANLESGEAVVGGLRLFAELSGGAYPRDLTMNNLVQELTDLIQTKKEEGMLDEEPDKETMNNLMNLTLIGTFYNGVSTEDRDPAYYGDTVTAEDAGKVLFRWRIQDSENYRVIFGDLRIEDVTPERLAELER